jgi:hypothetical protein
MIRRDPKSICRMLNLEYASDLDLVVAGVSLSRGSAFVFRGGQPFFFFGLSTTPPEDSLQLISEFGRGTQPR